MLSDFTFGVLIGSAASMLVAVSVAMLLFTAVVPQKQRRMVRILLSEMDRPLRWQLSREDTDEISLRNAAASLTVNLSRRGSVFRLESLYLDSEPANNLCADCSRSEVASLQKQAAILYHEIVDVNMQMPSRVVPHQQELKSA